MGKQRIRLLPLLALILTVYSCDHQVAANDNKSLPGYWKSNEAVRFVLPEMETEMAYNLFIELRNTNDYQYSNLFLIASLEYPNGKIVTDTLEYRMTNPDGSWLGSGIGDLKANRLWYKEGFVFDEQGAYELVLSQAMRRNGQPEGLTQLNGITDVGYSIEAVTTSEE